MFIKVQEPSIMKAKKRNTVYILSILIAALSITSCSSVGDIPQDDIYYSRNTNNPSEYNWDDFQKNTESYGSKTVTNSVSGDSFDYNSSYQGDVADGESSNTDYDKIDEYYDSSYESQLNRFGSNSSNSGFGYYDDYNTGGNSCYSCNSGPNVSLGFSFGMGYGYGYGYGYPYYYPYYPYYSYPYYGYNSYWAGYNAGYNAGYWNGYYGYGGYYPGYGGGYYPDYGGSTIAYGPRGSNVTGTTIPRNRTGGSGSSSNVNQKTVVAGGAMTPVSRDGTTVASTGGQTTANQVVSGRTVRIGKPDSEVSATKDVNSQNVVIGNRSSVSSNNKQPQKTYQKPKSYQNLSTQQSKSRSEYVRPTNKTEVGSANQKRSTNIRTNPTTSRDVSSSNSNKKNIYSPSKSRSSSYGTTKPSKSYSSPSRSNTSSRSYSSPTSTKSRSGSSSVGTSRSSSKSSGSSSRSYSGSSSGSSSRSSGSTSGGGGGSPRRR